MPKYTSFIELLLTAKAEWQDESPPVAYETHGKSLTESFNMNAMGAFEQGDNWATMWTEARVYTTIELQDLTFVVSSVLREPPPDSKKF